MEDIRTVASNAVANLPGQLNTTTEIQIKGCIYRIVKKYSHAANWVLDTIMRGKRVFSQTSDPGFLTFSDLVDHIYYLIYEIETHYLNKSSFVYLKIPDLDCSTIMEQYSVYLIDQL